MTETGEVKAANRVSGPQSGPYGTPTPTLSVLILARDEEANLPGCLESVTWADEVVVVVDRASRDETREVAEAGADVVAVREFDDFASQRNAALELARGDWVFAIDADERATPELAAEVRRLISDPAGGVAGYRVPIRSVVLGRPFRFSGTQHDRPLRLFCRDAGRWVGAVHETVELRGGAGQLNHALQHRTIPDMQTFLRKLNEYTTLEAIKFEREGRRQHAGDLALRPVWTFFKLYLGKQGFRDGLEGFVFCALSGLSVAVRNWKYRERLRARGAPVSDLKDAPPRRAGGVSPLSGGFRQEADVLGQGADVLGQGADVLGQGADAPRSPGWEAEVAARFDRLHRRFKARVDRNDVRLEALRDCLGPLDGRRVLDLGCGKGRFAARLAEAGASVVGLDRSAAMLAGAEETGQEFDRVLGSARRLPFAAGAFDAVIAVEVFEHLTAWDAVLREVRRVLRPGGMVAIVDKNAGSWNARRPWLPNLAVKWIDERRGRWMYPSGGPVCERWFMPRAFARRLRRVFEDVRIAHPLAPEEAVHLVFRRLPCVRLFTVWSARVPGGARCTGS